MSDFEILESQAKDLFRAFPDLEFKTIAAFTLIIGWLLTAEHAQSFIVKNSTISLLGAGFAFGMFSIVQIFFLRGHYLKLLEVSSAMENLAKSGDHAIEIVNTYKVGPFLPVSYAAINVAFCFAIITLVYVIGKI